MRKKGIVSLLALALATTGAFAAVDLSGELIAGYAFQYNDIHDEWTNHIMGQDGEDTNTTKLLLGIGDDEAYLIPRCAVSVVTPVPITRTA